VLRGLSLLGSAVAGAAPEVARPLVVIDVPFIAQSPDLCGGAAAAMVLRYWGATDVQAEDFASLVDPARGGISTGDLAAALGSRGAIVHPIRAGAEDAKGEITSGRPVIALIDGGGGPLHYVVIVAWAAQRVLFHDPSLGPFRVGSETEFLARWSATGGFALVVTPGPAPRSAEVPATPPPAPRKASACDPLVDHAIELARGLEPELAVSELLAAHEMCGQDARALSALAGVRFRQKRFSEAAAFARQSSERDAADPETWRLLGASLFLADEPRAALGPWNRIGEPRLDRVVIEGLVRTRQDIATAAIGLSAREVLTPDSVARAERRLEQLPTASGGKLTYQPLGGGRADVVVSVGETGLVEPWRILALRLAIGVAANRESRIRFNSPTGRGEAFEIGGRFASHRPAAWALVETPRFAGLPGVVALSALWDRQTYRPGGIGSLPAILETRRRGAIDWSHWATPSARLNLGVGVDRFDGRGSYASAKGGFDLRAGQDRIALLGDAAGWTGLGGARGFGEFGGTLALRGAVRPRRVAFRARLDARRATSEAPLALWPGAGRGPGRPLLLRASRLLTRGEVTGEAFGRGLLHGTAEVEVRAGDRGVFRLGLAAFADWAKPWDTFRTPGASEDLFALGGGVRLRTSSAAFRIDLAKQPGTKGVVFSAGVIPPWPR
jgi:predicted double-glycine peptidase